MLWDHRHCPKPNNGLEGAGKKLSPLLSNCRPVLTEEFNLAKDQQAAFLRHPSPTGTAGLALHIDHSLAGALLTGN